MKISAIVTAAAVWLAFVPVGFFLRWSIPANSRTAGGWPLGSHWYRSNSLAFWVCIVTGAVVGIILLVKAMKGTPVSLLEAVGIFLTVSGALLLFNWALIRLGSKLLSVPYDGIWRGVPFHPELILALAILVSGIALVFMSRKPVP